MQDLQKETKNDKVGLHERSSQQRATPDPWGLQGRAAGTKTLQDRRVVGDRVMFLSEVLKLQ